MPAEFSGSYFAYHQIVQPYDLSSELDELKHLAADPAYTADLTRLRAALDEWMKSNHDGGIATDCALEPKSAKPAAK